MSNFLGQFFYVLGSKKILIFFLKIVTSALKTSIK